MTDQELLQAMSQMMDEKLKRLDAIEEDLAEIRSGVNTLLDWAERVGDTISFPLPKIAQ